MHEIRSKYFIIQSSLRITGLKLQRKLIYNSTSSIGITVNLVLVVKKIKKMIQLFQTHTEIYDER